MNKTLIFSDDISLGMVITSTANEYSFNCVGGTLLVNDINGNNTVRWKLRDVGAKRVLNAIQDAILNSSVSSILVKATCAFDDNDEIVAIDVVCK